MSPQRTDLVDTDDVDTGDTVDVVGMADPVSRLRAVALRVTAPRIAVLEAVSGSPHSDADTLARIVRESLGTVSTQAVYDVLKALTGAGLLRRIEPAGSPARYETRVGDNHHHLVCRRCGTMRDVDCAVGTAPCLTPSDTSRSTVPDDFEVDEAEVTFWGVCADCRP